MFTHNLASDVFADHHHGTREKPEDIFAESCATKEAWWPSWILKILHRTRLVM